MAHLRNNELAIGSRTGSALVLFKRVAGQFEHGDCALPEAFAARRAAINSFTNRFRSSSSSAGLEQRHSVTQ